MSATDFAERIARIEARRGIILKTGQAAAPAAAGMRLPPLPVDEPEPDFLFQPVPLADGDRPRRFLTGFAWTLLSFAILLLAPHLPAALAGLGFDPATQLMAQRILMVPAAISVSAWAVAIFVIAICYNRWEKTAAFGCGTALGAFIPLCLNWTVGVLA